MIMGVKGYTLLYLRAKITRIGTAFVTLFVRRLQCSYFPRSILQAIAEFDCIVDLYIKSTPSTSLSLLVLFTLSGVPRCFFQSPDQKGPWLESSRKITNAVAATREHGYYRARQSSTPCRTPTGAFCGLTVR